MYTCITVGGGFWFCVDDDEVMVVEGDGCLERVSSMAVSEKMLHS